jgi:hypothetical protein
MLANREKSLAFALVGLGVLGLVVAVIAWWTSQLIVLALGAGAVFWGLVGAPIYFSRARRLRALREGKGVLARWTYEDGQEAIISLSCAYVRGSFHEWTSYGTRLDRAGLIPGTNGAGPACLEIVYSSEASPTARRRRYVGANARLSREVYVDVPEGKEAAARQVVNWLRSSVAR